MGVQNADRHIQVESPTLPLTNPLTLGVPLTTSGPQSIKREQPYYLPDNVIYGDSNENLRKANI